MWIVKKVTEAAVFVRDILAFKSWPLCNVLYICCFLFLLTSISLLQRKAASDKQITSKPRNSQKNEPNSTPMDYELDDPFPNSEPQSQRPKRLKRPKKSVNEKLEPAFTATPSIDSSQIQCQPTNNLASTNSNT